MRISSIGWCVSIVLFAFVVSMPILHAGFFGDDIWDSVLKGKLLLQHQTYWQGLKESLISWFAEGRFFPLNIFSTYTLFYYVADSETYQWIRFGCIWSSVFAFAWLVHVITRNNKAALVFLFLVPLCWSVRLVSDPLTSYAIFLPLFTLFAAGCIGGFLKLQETQHLRWGELSFFCYVGALATYELGILLLPLLLLCSYRRPSVPKKIVWAFILVTTIYLVMNVKLQITSLHVYQGIQIGSFTHFFKAFLAQVSAAFPLSYVLVKRGPIGLWQRVFPFMSEDHHGLFLIVLFIVTSGSLYCLQAGSMLSREARRLLVLLGLGLVLLPAVLIGLNARYQQSISLGNGYTPVYLQYFGMAMLILVFISLLQKQRHERLFRIVIALFLSVVISLSVVANFTSVTIANATVQTTYRQLVEKALHKNLFASVPNDALLIERFSIWNTKAFYRLHADRYLQKIIATNAFDVLPNVTSDPLFMIDGFLLPHSTAGAVWVGHFQDGHIQNPKVVIIADNQEDFERVTALLRGRYALISMT